MRKFICYVSAIGFLNRKCLKNEKKFLTVFRELQKFWGYNFYLHTVFSRIEAAWIF